ncbi:MAG TPA: Xaa-Pro peptidase family protein [Caulobacteraceae bacterium]|jgi:Xaa-Pro aminopeptidase|nr:Xaa-Pro peptidase family protein [Caulobacteraceae bacterium]
MLLNLPRAYEVMDRHGLDGLVAVDPINVYYLTDYWGPLMRMRRTFYNYAVLPRAEDQPAGIVVNGIELTRLGLQPEATWVPNRCGYLHPIYKDRRDFDPDVEDPEAIEHAMQWPVNLETLSPSEEKYLAAVEASRGRHSANALYGLKRALKDAGLSRAVVGSDDPRIGPWLHQVGLEGVEVRDAYSVFREIRMVKSPAELDLLRTAAKMNEAALDKTLEQLAPGVRMGDLQNAYAAEIAAGGGRSVYLATGHTAARNPDGRVVEGLPVTFDALCEFRNYHGDVGRTAVCGEPSAELVRRMQAVRVGAEIAYGMIRPGVTGNEVTTALVEGVRKAGFPGYLFATPHSVGLEHSDHPLPIGPTLPGGEGQFVFLEDMVFTIDMPYRELGWGNLHSEDQLRVTADGIEPLTSCDPSLRVRPGGNRGAGVPHRH